MQFYLRKPSIVAAWGRLNYNDLRDAPPWFVRDPKRSDSCREFKEEDQRKILRMVFDTGSERLRESDSLLWQLLLQVFAFENHCPRKHDAELKNAPMITAAMH